MPRITRLDVQEWLAPLCPFSWSPSGWEWKSTKNPSDFNDRMLVRLVNPQPRQAKYEGARKGVFPSSVFRFPNVSMQQNETTLPHSKTPSAHLLEGGCSMQSPGPIRPLGYTRWEKKNRFLQERVVFSGPY